MKAAFRDLQIYENENFHQTSKVKLIYLLMRAIRHVLFVAGK